MQGGRRGVDKELRRRATLVGRCGRGEGGGVRGVGEARTAPVTGAPTSCSAWDTCWPRLNGGRGGLNGERGGECSRGTRPAGTCRLQHAVPQRPRGPGDDLDGDVVVRRGGSGPPGKRRGSTALVAPRRLGGGFYSEAPHGRELRGRPVPLSQPARILGPRRGGGRRPQRLTAPGTPTHTKTSDRGATPELPGGGGGVAVGMRGFCRTKIQSVVR